ncbi:acyl carrier protein [Paenibacillus campi]|uniref:acyl carrier protein n=1 Tax=Paenibacillus campi TaxID=3106031 RepID=UPI002B001474|nr:acyl carrier protein [Paenibacillus sp. SGZ-1014]
MNNEQKLQHVFIEALGLTAETNVSTLTYNGIPEWDSIAHMALVAQMDDQFDIMLDTEHIIDISSFAKAKEVLSLYGITFE